ILWGAMQGPKPARPAPCRVGTIPLPAPPAGRATTTGGPPAASTLPAEIPIMPMADAVLFPTLSVPLHVVAPRDRAMVLDALKSDRIIGIVLRRPESDPDFVEGPTPPIFPIGCAGAITEVETVADGGYDIVLQAVARFRITREDTGKPYRIARVTVIPEARRADETSALQAERQKLETLLAGLSGRIGMGPV